MTCQLCGSTRTALAITRDGRAYCSNVAGCKDRQAATAAATAAHLESSAHATATFYGLPCTCQVRELTVNEARLAIDAAARIAARRPLTDREHTVYLAACAVVDADALARRAQAAAL